MHVVAVLEVTDWILCVVPIPESFEARENTEPSPETPSSTQRKDCKKEKETNLIFSFPRLT